MNKMSLMAGFKEAIVYFFVFNYIYYYYATTIDLLVRVVSGIFGSYLSCLEILYVKLEQSNALSCKYLYIYYGN